MTVMDRPDDGKSGDEWSEGGQKKKAEGRWLRLMKGYVTEGDGSGQGGRMVRSQGVGGTVWRQVRVMEEGLTKDDGKAGEGRSTVKKDDGRVRGRKRTMMERYRSEGRYSGADSGRSTGQQVRTMDSCGIAYGQVQA